ncbi:MAG: YIP1 family protein [Candidatus Binatia bacterium]
MAAEEFKLDDAVGSYVEVWKRVVLEPRAFFGALPAAGGLQPPLAFAAISLFVGGVGVLLFGGGLKGLVALVVLGLIRLFVGAAIVTLIAQSLFQGQGDYESTFRALGYATAIAVLIGVPFVQYFAALYGAFLLIVAIERAHSFDAVRASLTLLATAVTGFVIAHALGLWPTLARLSPLLG